MRLAFTIIFNGLHHLIHNDYFEKAIPFFDAWVFVEGATQSGGSTKWCKSMPAEMHKNGNSIDGTVEFLEYLAREYSNVHVKLASGLWGSKDEMVNTAVELLRVKGYSEGFLWEIDMDEQWRSEDIKAAEVALKSNQIKTGTFLCNYHMGNNYFAVGDWGEGVKQPYRRLWDWKGERFLSHEPPELEGGNGTMALLSQRFEHYSWFFEQDVKFKSLWYSDHESMYKKWKHLQVSNLPSIPIRTFLTGIWGDTNTLIVRRV